MQLFASVEELVMPSGCTSMPWLLVAVAVPFVAVKVRLAASTKTHSGRPRGLVGIAAFLTSLTFFLARARCLSAGLRYLRLTRLPRHDRGPVPGGNRSAASCQCTVLRRAFYLYATRSPVLNVADRLPVVVRLPAGPRVRLKAHRTVF